MYENFNKKQCKHCSVIRSLITIILYQVIQKNTVYENEYFITVNSKYLNEYITRIPNQKHDQ